MDEKTKSRGRLANWIVASLLLFVQLHLCQAEYVLPGGQTCFTCPALDEDDHSNAGTQLASAEHGDCHDCCEIRPCDEEGKAKAALAQASFLSLVFALPTELPNITIDPISEEAVELEFLAGCPPTGPPTSAQSRAPPYSSRV